MATQVSRGHADFSSYIHGRVANFATGDVLGCQEFFISALQLGKEKLKRIREVQKKFASSKADAGGIDKVHLGNGEAGGNSNTFMLHLGQKKSEKCMRVVWRPKLDDGLHVDFVFGEGIWMFFDIHFLDHDKEQHGSTDLLEVQLRHRVSGRFMSLDKATGQMIPVTDATTLRLVLKPKDCQQDTVESVRLSSSEQTFKMTSVADFWSSVGWALLAAFGSNLFWVGAWAMYDQGPVKPSNTRDTIFVIVGLVSGSLTDRLGLAYYKTPIVRLKQESFKISKYLEQASIARELTMMRQKRNNDKHLASIAALAEERALRLDAQAKAARTFWSHLVTLTGDARGDAESIGKFEDIYQNCISVAGLLGSVFLWVGVCNLMCVPVGMLQEHVPESDWYAQVAFNLATVALSFYLFQVSETLGQRAGSEPSAAVDTQSLPSPAIRAIAWTVIATDLIASMMLWIGMCDLLGTRLATADSSGDNGSFGYADDEESMWAELFYVALGLLCQLSTELIPQDSENSDGGWFVGPAFFDVVSILGGVFLNYGIWTLIDTNLVVAWEYCSFDGSGGGDGWPTCFERNLTFMIVGLGVLASQRALLDESGVDSSPVMVLAVIRPRQQARREFNKKVNTLQDMESTITGTLVMKKSLLDEDGNYMEDASGTIANLVAVPEERVKVTANSKEEHPEHLCIAVEIRPMRHEVAQQLAPLEVPARRLIIRDQRMVLKKLQLVLAKGSDASFLELGPFRDAFIESSGDWAFKGSEASGAPKGVAGSAKSVIRKLSTLSTELAGRAAGAKAKPKAKQKGSPKAKMKASSGGASLEEPLLSETGDS